MSASKLLGRLRNVTPHAHFQATGVDASRCNCGFKKPVILERRKHKARTDISPLNRPPTPLPLPPPESSILDEVFLAEWKSKKTVCASASLVVAACLLFCPGCVYICQHGRRAHTQLEALGYHAPLSQWLVYVARQQCEAEEWQRARRPQPHRRPDCIMKRGGQIRGAGFCTTNCRLHKEWPPFFLHN